MKPTPLEIKYYKQLVGKTIKGIEFFEMEGRPVPSLLFTDGTCADVLMDPEGNGPGHLNLTTPEYDIVEQ